jgi:predicted AAA+ superfamily ATPase
MFSRRLVLPKENTETFFLWGPRQTGKTTLLQRAYPDAFRIDLLKADHYRRYLTHPERMREEIEAFEPKPFVVIDEVQKVPKILDEVHWLHETHGLQFALCGSSARKVKRGAANLLGGRAVRYELRGLTSAELGSAFHLERILNHGYLPRIYESSRPRRLLNSYVADYLKEEVASEGLVRNLPAFSEFLNIASLSDTHPVNYSNIARECGVSSQTVRGYFEILEDTLMAGWLPSYRKRPKRRVIHSPKLYFADVGVVGFLARRGRLEPGSELFGNAFENWCFHEITAYNFYAERFAHLSYWRLASGIEVDFVINDMAVAIEAKSSRTISSHHLKGLRQLVIDHPNVERRIVLCLEDRPRRTPDGIEIVPYGEFVRRLWSGDIF